jgi:hypothetical protein
MIFPSPRAAPTPPSFYIRLKRSAAVIALTRVMRHPLSLRFTIIVFRIFYDGYEWVFVNRVNVIFVIINCCESGDPYDRATIIYPALSPYNPETYAA